MIYTSLCVMLLMRAASTLGQAGGGWALEIRSFFGLKMALTYRLDAISQGPNNSRFSGPNPLPLALVMDAARIKSITHGPYKS
jgi:hypothetical protein